MLAAGLFGLGRFCWGSWAGERSALFHNRELQPAFLCQDAIENHLHTIPCVETAACAFADNFVRVFTPGVAIVTQRVYRHQALNKEIGKFDEESVLGWIQHQACKLLADTVLHESNFLPLHQLSFSHGLPRAAGA